jgi:hypothetical protein
MSIDFETLISLNIPDRIDLVIENAKKELAYYSRLRRAIKIYPDIRIRYSHTKRPFSKLINPRVNRLRIETFENYSHDHGHIVALYALFSKLVYGVDIYANPVDLKIGTLVDGKPELFDNLESILRENDLPKNAELWILEEIQHMHQNDLFPKFEE